MNTDSRTTTRALCADLVSVEWKDQDGSIREIGAVLKDISAHGACLHAESPIPLNARLLIRREGTQLFTALPIYCVFRDTVYSVGVAYEAGLVWSKHTFLPRHLLD